MKRKKRADTRKMLMVSRILDSNDPVGSFTQRWAEVLASKVDYLYFICLEAYDVTIKAKNFKYFSLGKEKGYRRPRLLINYYRYLFKVMGDVDGFFGHMNSLYSVLAVPLAKLYGVKVISWVAFAPKPNFLIKLNILLSDKMVTASEESLKTTSPKKEVIGHGIDVSIFQRKEDVKRNKKIIYIGRLSPPNNSEIIFEAVGLIGQTIREKGWKVEIYGSTPTYASREYKGELVALTDRLKINDILEFKEAVPNHMVPDILNESSISVNMVSTGGAGKSMLESMATETITVLCTDTFNDHLGEKLTETLIYRPKDPKDLAEKLKKLISLIESDKNKAADIGRELREIVVKHHNLDTLMEKILSLY